VDPASAGRAAADVATPDPRAAVAQIVLDDGRRTWHPRPDLLASSRLDPHVVVEPSAGGLSRLRFGDGITGRAPSPQATFTARYRIGGGAAGNVSSGRLTTWLLRPDGTDATDDGARVAVWNPCAASGGTDPEPLEQVRQLAPAAYRRQLRAVTDADYAAVAESVPGVQRSVARRRWTGSWYVEEVLVDPVAAHGQDADLPRAVLDLLDVRRMAGRDVEVALPVYVPLRIGLFVCVAGDVERPAVERRLLDALSARVLPDGPLGFFHPDRFTFGQRLLLSDLVAAVMAVAGVAWVEVRSFCRLGGPPDETGRNLTAGRIDVGPREVLRCDSDPDDPEAGRVELELSRGS
jgi:predicted phage baseplate assembly protein